MTDTHEIVRERYAAAARQAASGSGACCGPEEGIGAGLYSALERADLPDAAVLASLGCGNPTVVADLHEGERVLDLGSGGGIDVLLSAARVGPTGRAFGLDMTDEMLTLARRNAVDAGATNVEFLKGYIEAIPLPSDSIDVVISNCVVNLAADKAAVFRGDRSRAAARRPHRHHRHRRKRRADAQPSARSEARTSDALPERSPSPSSEPDSRAAGLSDISLTPTHQVTDGMHSVIARAVKPADAAPAPAFEPVELQMASPGCGCGSGGCC